MNNNEKYQKFALCREMLETPRVIREFDIPNLDVYVDDVKASNEVLLTGEGSSRIFPAKRAISQSLMKGESTRFITEGSTQAMDYDLKNKTVFGSSNSGRTKELIRLFDKLKKAGHTGLYGVTASEDSTLESYCKSTFVLNCGGEDAVAATKSVAEQALFYDAVRAGLKGEDLKDLAGVADAVEKALTLEIDPEVTKLIAGAGMIYFAGRNTGVAEELTLKTNEITRKKSDFLEGTYAAHGIEEVMNSDDVLIVVDPFEEEEEKFIKCLTDAVGVKIISIAARKTSFTHSVVIPDAGDFQDYVELAAGWNLLVETGLELGIDLDTPVRARKVGNEYTPA
ncbi:MULTISPECIES: SIS domain-containing protein [unclassified Oceanispirochaeta]|uniref:SIS domain-containing protein n=1 Tax=unclassified Oceanispirochaeta TaxID=2635722 RepID=UPI000E08EED4|nr:MULTISPECIES: SIS domain-containing protein [unclassified Oceanispirochaeta]MBF9017218.1 SIS domain-containing protein [Oceanispirochaeta sp. M2]NPD73667.1 SIS domain-containing protein [Oceanispirochaeta sp. M1]RDG30597.1 sugar isomerase [Oceanispirochaeta sp. M1]